MTQTAGEDESLLLSCLDLSISGEFFLTSEQGEIILDIYRRRKMPLLQAVERYLPQMVSSHEACKFVLQSVSIEEAVELRRKMGSLFRYDNYSLNNNLRCLSYTSYCIDFW